MDNFGQADMTPATRVIRVRDTGPNNRAPTVTITSPTQLQNNVVALGQSLLFSAIATDPDPQDAAGMTYQWYFDGAAADSDLQNPGQITFNRPGTYRIRVVAIDSRGKRSAPATVSVTVQGGQFGSSIAPEGTIALPSTNSLTVSVGDTVNFRATGTDADGNLPLSYRWDFNGAEPSSYTQNPGNVTFNKVGTYRVQLTVADNTGATDPTPDVITVTVVSQAGFQGAQPATPGTGFGASPVVTITSPATDVSNIPIGGSVNFQATATDPDNNIPLSYRWTFGNGLPDQFVQNPGSVTFNQPGTYFVTLTVTDTLGNIGTDIVQVVVGGNNGANIPGNGLGFGAPNAIINAPAMDVVIGRGESVYFAGDAIAPNGDARLTYLWDFGGGAVNSNQRVPGNVVFNTPGSYTVKLTVTNSAGQTDQTPATVRVTVL